ncbi:MAG: DEAD/DEAH box helicase [Phormidium sp. BM_Day4_Bin.17]|nr:DEAD/DEAH box helicase [Phormidium sp. BM_Day4_Bin.17]UCJ10485.1 MAG: DEAD/DEAH box helicase [Phormidium sp. PBR-2020]
MTKVLHGTWIPEDGDGFVQEGAFYIWVESQDKLKRKNGPGIHPFHLSDKALEEFVHDNLGMHDAPRRIGYRLQPQYFLLPSRDNQPLLSWELATYLEAELEQAFEFQFWQILCYRLETITAINTSVKTEICNAIATLNDLHFFCLYHSDEFQLGADLLFWYHYSQAFRDIILKDQYIPSFKYHITQPKSRKKRKPFAIYAGWEIVSPHYESLIETYAPAMPIACGSGWSKPPKHPEFHDSETLLRHFSECIITQLASRFQTTKKLNDQLSKTVLNSCVTPGQILEPLDPPEEFLETYTTWQAWRNKILQSYQGLPFNLYIQLISPEDPDDPWFLNFLVSPKADPSLRVELADYWQGKSSQQQVLRQQLGDNFEAELLINLGYAARMYPKLWDGLETPEPVGVRLTSEEAWEFLHESAWVLEDADYKVLLPAWWTPSGRRRAKLRLKASSSSQSAGNSSNKSYLNAEQLVKYQYELAIGDETVSREEWQKLVEAKQPLIQFRGEWVELDLAQMEKTLKFWDEQGKDEQSMTLMELLQRQAESDEALEVERDSTLERMLQQLTDKTAVTPIEVLDGFEGTLRDYQKRGVAWLSFLEQVGLNGCLADDMGLGKTIQVIARLIQERQDEARVQPTLLIAPTSVLGNWQKEVSRFAPQLRTQVHHGGSRVQESKAFKQAAAEVDVLITSYTLVRKDANLFNGVDWQRIVLDEAQNIKNPKTAQTKAILKLKAQHRLALTGTPVENRLLDLWSIFNFLNPGYLGTQNKFRKSFEVPIQRNNSLRQATTLKKLVEPFILRRLKTDKSIIKDLPDKIEQKVYCNLTKEQASLYEAVVKEVEKSLVESEGIQRKGLILSTLTRLKQICNHPRQFLQDESEFSPGRSHKLSRLTDMLDEVIAEGESVLIFTQFRDIGDAMEQYLRHSCRYPTYYIHGATSRQRRDRMIQEFQNPDTPPSIFILSLKAGGVGITLTKANHVFHFDRWWNPAVENQATDRAFRIGQEKNVFVHKFVTLGSLEERIDQMIEDKQKLAESVVGSDESWLTELDNDTFRDLIALNRNAVL